MVDGQPTLPFLYALTDCPGGRWTWDEMPRWNLTNFARIGFRLFQVSLWLESIWRTDGVLDLDLPVRQIRGLLEVAPDAAVVVRLHVNAPRWWIAAHPDEATGYAGEAPTEPEPVGLYRQVHGDLDLSLRASLASETWLTEASHKTAELCRALAGTPEGNHVVGFQPAAGVFHEWHYWGFIHHHPDIGPAMTRRFRAWLTGRYGSDTALRTAWGRDDVSLAGVQVPGLEERVHTADTVFRDPATERPVIDYFRCQHEVVAEDILHFCRTVKQSWPRRLLTGTFYGYLFTMFGKQSSGGHLEMDRILASPHLDYLSAPQAYQGYCREPGGSAHSRGIADSVHLHGKIWLDEMDQRTSLRRDAERVYFDREAEDIAVLRRNSAWSYTRGIGLWYYDFGPNYVSGWWDHPVLLEEIRALTTAFRARYGQADQPRDVAFVYDTASHYYTAYDSDRDTVSESLVDAATAAAMKSGVVFDMVLLSDIGHVDWGHYRAVVFTNTYVLTPDQRAYIRDHIAVGGRHLVWSYLPGYLDGERKGLDLVSDVVGLPLRGIALAEPPAISVAGPGLPGVRFALPRAVAPLACVDEVATGRGAAVTLGVLAGSGAPAFVRRDTPESTVWYTSVPILDAALFRAIFSAAGAHLYAPAGNVVYAGGGILCLHATDGGATDVMLRNGARLQVTMQPRSTVILDSQTGQIIRG